MANNIFQPELIEQAEKNWMALREEISKNVKVLQDFRKETSQIPSQYVNSLNNINTAQKNLNTSVENTVKSQSKLTAVQKEEERQLKRNEQLKAKLSKSTSDQAKQNARLNEQLKANNRELRQEAKALVRGQGLYNLVQQRVNKLTRQYNDLATKKALNNKLSFREEMSLKQVQTQLNRYQKVLKGVDADIGKYTRNVGNYRSGFDGLSFSVAQLTREAPAFANSLQTGFLALSNNIPILFDEINKLKVANQQLAASGKPTESILKRLAGAVFSWHTALSVGVTLLTIYGKDIVEAFTKGSAVTDKLSASFRDLDESTTNNIGRIHGLTAAVNDVTKSDEKRLAAIQELNKIYPELNLNESLEQENLDKLNNSVAKYVKLAVTRIKLAKLETEISELVLNNLELENKLLTINISENDFRVKRYRELVSRSKEENLTFEEKSKLVRQIGDAYLLLTPKQREYFDINNEIALNQAEINKLTEKYLSGIDETLMLEEKRGKALRDGQSLEEVILENRIKRLNEEIDHEGNINRLKIKAVQERTQLEIQLEELKTKRIIESNKLKGEELLIAETKLQNKIVDIIKKSNNEIQKLREERGENEEDNLFDFSTSERLIKELVKETGMSFDELEKMYQEDAEAFTRFAEQKLIVARRAQKILDQFRDVGVAEIDFVFRTAGLESFQEIVDGTIQKTVAEFDRAIDSLQKYRKELEAAGKSTEEVDSRLSKLEGRKFASIFNAIADSAQEAFSLINSLSEQNFQAQFDRLSKERDMAIEFAGDSSAARAEIERQFEDKRRSIQRKQAEDQKKQAIFNIVIDTAQGIVSTIGQVGFPAAIPLIAAIAAIGAAQLALVNSSEVPQFHDGTEDTGRGGKVDNKGGFNAVLHPNERVMTKKQNKLMHGYSNDKVANIVNDYHNDALFQKELNRMALYSNIIHERPLFQPSMTIENGITNDQFRAGINDLKKTINSQPVGGISINERGMEKYIQYRNNRKIILNNKFHVKGRSV